MVTQLTLWDWPDEKSLRLEERERAKLELRYRPVMRYVAELRKWVSYVGNKNVPGLRLYRYKEAFSYEFVRRFVRRFRSEMPTPVVLDPFMGMGTTPYTARRLGVQGVGVDKLPVAVAIAQGLASLTDQVPGEVYATFERLRKEVDHADPAPIASDVSIVQRAFPEDVRFRLQQWKRVILDLPRPIRDVFFVLFLSILEPCSWTTKDGQFLRLRPEKPLRNPDDVLREQVLRAEEDIQALQTARERETWGPTPRVLKGDARELSTFLPSDSVGLIVTSPPYANRYDYTRTYSLELCFGFVDNFEGLRNLRHSILRSHIESRLDETKELAPHSAVEEVERVLRGKDLNNPRIPIMLRAYFVDMAQVIDEMFRVLGPQGRVVMVVDNVRFEGEMVPVDLILSDLAHRVGFEVEEILVARFKGNSSQQMKKYGRKPVRESVLIWRKMS